MEYTHTQGHKKKEIPNLERERESAERKKRTNHYEDEEPEDRILWQWGHSFKCGVKSSHNHVFVRCCAILRRKWQLLPCQRRQIEGPPPPPSHSRSGKGSFPGERVSATVCNSWKNGVEKSH